MIKLAKFLSLERSTRLRKLWRMVYDWELHLRSTQPLNSELQSFLRNVALSFQDSAALYYDAELVPMAALLDQATIISSSPRAQLRAANDARHLLATYIGKEAAEWDLLPPGDVSERLMQPQDSRQAHVKIVYCDDIRSPFNVGSIFRTAEAFGFSEVILSPRCPTPDHPRLKRSAMGATDWIPWKIMEFDLLQKNLQMAERPLPIFAVELGGTSAAAFPFPESGIAVLGSEELGVRPEIIDACRNNLGLVSIPLQGAKASLNVGVSFGIIAALWRPGN